MKRRKMKLSKGEKLLYFSGFMGLILTLVLKIFCGASVGNLNISVEKLRYEIIDQEKKNESLVMKINELTAFDTVKDVVDDMGLAYYNENIIVINR